MLSEVTFPFVAELSAASRRELKGLGARRVRAHEPLLARGDNAGGAYLVVGGALRVFYVNADGREATLYRVEAGGTCILALTAAWSGEPYPAWVEAGAQGSEFVRVPTALFRRLFDDERPFRDFMFGVLSARIFELMQALEETGSAQMEQRVARYLVKSAKGASSVAVTQAAIASELGTAREVVFRALRALAARGLLRTGRGSISLLEPRALARLARGG